MKIILVILLVMITIINISCESSSPKQTVDEMCKAAKEMNLSKFLDCTDLDVLAQMKETDVETMKKSITNNPELREMFTNMMKLWGNGTYVVRSEEEYRDNMRKVTISHIPETKVYEVDTHTWIFVNRGGKWQISYYLTDQLLE